MSSSKEVTPTNTASKIVPASGDSPLASPFKDVAQCDISTGSPVLTYSCAVMIPAEVNWSSVSVLQYYSNDSVNSVSFYFVYNLEGTPSGNFTQYNVLITALKTDYYGNKIPLENLTSVDSLLRSSGPKTSRGTITTVSPVG